MKVFTNDESMDNFAVGYILNKGLDYVLNITDEDVEKMRLEMIKEEEETRKKGKISLFSPDFAVKIVNHARALAHDDFEGKIFDIIKYARKSK